VSSVNLDSSGRPRTNWAGNIDFAAPDFHRPATVSQLRAIVARARQIRVLATGHSFNDRLPDFLNLMRHYDAAGKFRNAYTDRYLRR